MPVRTSRQPRSSASRRRRVRLGVEPLEDRTLPAITVYAGPGAVLNDAASDGSPAMTSVHLDVADSRPVADVEVLLDVSHLRTSDLSATLIAPDGRRVLLFASVGGDGAHFRGTRFDDAATTPIS